MPAVALTIVALVLRLTLALGWPNDEPDDGRLYTQLAKNLIERGVYSEATDEPYAPTYARVPGYPLVLAGLMRVFGADATRAPRVAQAIVDTGSCWLAAALALAWLPASAGPFARARAHRFALALAALCPFTAIYASTLLSETWRFAAALGALLAGSYAVRAPDRGRAAARWTLAGALAGVATMIRPDGALVAGALGGTLVFCWIVALVRPHPDGPSAVRATLDAVACGMALVLGFVVVLSPWTLRNARTFGVFQPIAPANATMPGEFVAHGYERWLATWIDDPSYVEALDWNLDRRRIEIEQVPTQAFDDADERARVAALLERYDHPVHPTPAPSEEVERDEGDSDNDASDTDDDVAMTPEIDAGFARIAAERVARHPLRHYVELPVERALSMWLDTHSRYFPFAGQLWPASARPPGTLAMLALVTCAALTALYGVVGSLGALRLVRTGHGAPWLALLVLLVLPRLALLAQYANPEPRYTTEFFLLLSAAAGGLALEDGEEELVAPRRSP